MPIDAELEAARPDFAAAAEDIKTYRIRICHSSGQRYSFVLTQVKSMGSGGVSLAKAVHPPREMLEARGKAGLRLALRSIRIVNIGASRGVAHARRCRDSSASLFRAVIPGVGVAHVWRVSACTIFHP